MSGFESSLLPTPVPNPTPPLKVIGSRDVLNKAESQKLDGIKQLTECETFPKEKYAHIAASAISGCETITDQERFEEAQPDLAGRRMKMLGFSLKWTRKEDKLREGREDALAVMDADMEEERGEVGEMQASAQATIDYLSCREICSFRPEEQVGLNKVRLAFIS
ncbi:hypothetical protein VTL71DRAFT_16164 [Oculimacula yallundae]|uniref:Uncharacterized protein n=1 Tax=Oculimacula yallundae TaxID=86028 RepID=A0ABR4CDN7_9HELO